MFYAFEEVWYVLVSALYMHVIAMVPVRLLRLDGDGPAAVAVLSLCFMLLQSTQ